MAPIHLIATLRPAAGKEQLLREVLRQTVDRVADIEIGCLTFLLTETRGDDVVVVFKVIERWLNLEALEQHHGRDWLQQMYQTFKDNELLDGTERIEHLTLIAGFVAPRVLQGLSTSSVFTIGYCLLLDTVGSEHIGSALGFTSMSLSSLGLLAGPIIGGLIYDLASYVAVFAPAFALIIIEIILCGFLQPLPPGYKHEHHPSSEQSPLLHHRTEGQGQSSPPTLLILLRSPRFLIAMIGMCMLNTFMTALDAVLPIFLQDLFHYTSSQIAIVFLSNSLPLMILSPLAGYFVDRIGPFRPAILGFVLTAPSLMLLGLIHQNTIFSSVLLRLFLFWFGCGVSLAMPALMTEISMATEAVEKRHPGVFGARGAYSQAYGLSNAAFAAGTLAGPLYAGYIRKWAGWGAMTVSMGVLSLVAVGLVVGFTGRRGGWSGCGREDV
ncbi:major facilitator superfamily MFS_1 [Aspergillus oryzae]|uniref:Major facilitator superfamily MFS_1 n=2 Tax=Aspergillus oryzae TaxID=5062 RepID=A0A1S9DDD2_ASPOZ|nr:major facilitator superfamily MFS_1 [Aspergillus oryzae]